MNNVLAFEKKTFSDIKLPVFCIGKDSSSFGMTFRGYSSLAVTPLLYPAP